MDEKKLKEIMGWSLIGIRVLLPMLFVVYFLVAQDESAETPKLRDTISLIVPNGSQRTISVKALEEMLKDGPSNLMVSFFKMGLLDLATQIDLDHNNYELKVMSSDEVLGFIKVESQNGNISFKYFLKNPDQAPQEINPTDFPKHFDPLFESEELTLRLDSIPKSLNPLDSLSSNNSEP